ncbi:DUF599 domain-containing protein [Novispirillum itersonii]|uniref:Putative membrane protein n=1 Tax=Novispirillum itersonii TaxID=189 RepID=A0A7X0DL11_NOVIT|nr:DUF599 domain-containing protein [Novispirillum itersonii]MBB6209506.1 putative membrane protein [Novispirillum itersonii]
MGRMGLDWVTPYDTAALLWFLVLWVGYTLYTDHTPARHRTISSAISRRRTLWLREAGHRDLRMIDTAILGNLITGVGFFASTTILVIGGLMAMMGVTAQVRTALSSLPLAGAASEAALEAKIAFLLAIFIYAFFKFAWAFRLANYCSITVGCLPASAHADSERSRAISQAAAVLSIRSGHHFNRGLRAYFFALGALGWLVHPWLFALVSTGVVIVLYRREFNSQAVIELRRLEETESRSD